MVCRHSPTASFQRHREPAVPRIMTLGAFHRRADRRHVSGGIRPAARLIVAGCTVANAGADGARGGGATAGRRVAMKSHDDCSLAVGSAGERSAATQAYFRNRRPWRHWLSISGARRCPFRSSCSMLEDGPAVWKFRDADALIVEGVVSPEPARLVALMVKLAKKSETVYETFVSRAMAVCRRSACSGREKNALAAWSAMRC